MRRVHLSNTVEHLDDLLSGVLVTAGGEHEAYHDDLQVPARGDQGHVLQHAQRRRLLTRTCSHVQEHLDRVKK